MKYTIYDNIETQCSLNGSVSDTMGDWSSFIAAMSHFNLLFPVPDIYYN